MIAILGAGGMGEVYRARDARLNRDVAIKVLPELFAKDGERLARFTREAQTLAALNHPNIAQVYGLEESGGIYALVMELVEGEDLSDRIARGPMPFDDALPIARQIANALEAAHEQGIVHRDLKPANVKVRADGTVKVLDFGLAKAIDPTGAGPDKSNSPTLTARATQMGMILGTAAYMAPEQAKGRPVDRRADIWAFGVVLFEMLTGRRTFDGEDVSEVLATVLKSDPVWTALPSETPSSVRRLLRRCLEKDPRKRLSAIGDARLDLDDSTDAAEVPTGRPVPAVSPTARRTLWSRAWPALAGIALAAGAAARFWPHPAALPGHPVRLSILAPPGASLYPDSNGVAISPDGTTVAFLVGNMVRTKTELWVRSLDSTDARKFEGVEGATTPFWSPDSQRIGFFTNDGKLRTVAAAGGRPEIVCDSADARGAVWTSSNLIIFARSASGPIYKVPATGGSPVQVTTLDPARKEYGHRFPTLLPDGQHFLYVALPGRDGRFDVFAGSLADSSKTFVGSMDAAPVYADPGWLLYARQGVLVAHPFDPKRLVLTGPPISLGDEPSVILDPATSWTAGRSTSVSASGELAYFAAPSINTTAEWYDRGGRRVGTLDVPPGHYERAAISPDGAHAILVRSTSPSESSLWLVDLARAGASPLTAGPGRNDAPVWSPDGRRIVFASDRDGAQGLFTKAVDDASPEQLLYTSDVLFKNPTAWSRDGQSIIVMQLDPGTQDDLWVLPATGGDLKPFVVGHGRDTLGTPSPDGHAVIYLSDATGNMQLNIQSFPSPGHRVQISPSGAGAAWWSRDGREIVFAGSDFRSLWRVSVAPGIDFSVSTPTRLADLPADILSIEATPDLQRFLALSPEHTGVGSITVVQRWQAALAKAR